MTARERLEMWLDWWYATPPSLAWHAVVHEKTVRVGPFVITSRKRETAREMNAFQIGRDLERACPRPPDPEPERHLRIV